MIDWSHCIWLEYFVTVVLWLNLWQYILAHKLIYDIMEYLLHISMINQSDRLAQYYKGTPRFTSLNQTLRPCIHRLFTCDLFPNLCSCDQIKWWWTWLLALLSRRQLTGLFLRLNKVMNSEKETSPLAAGSYYCCVIMWSRPPFWSSHSCTREQVTS